MHELQAIVTSSCATREFERAWPGQRSKPLTNGLSIWALDRSSRDRLGAAGFLALDLEASAEAGALVTSLDPILTALRGASIQGPLGLIITQYFGGAGAQAAVLIEGGEIRVGPIVAEGAINRILAALGLECGPEHRDEFEAAGLDRWRSTDDLTMSGREHR
jgi:hypothetical protein